jgi:hypothetical protein
MQPSHSPNTTTGHSINASNLKPEAVALETRSLTSEEMDIAPMPRERSAYVTQAGCNDEHANKPSVAEIWAELSTPDHVEKAHDEELRWRHKIREMGTIHPGRPASTASVNEPREP